MNSVKDLVVVKFGGASLASPSLISKAARSVVNIVKSGKRIVVVVSAMGKTTDELLSTIKAVSSDTLSPEHLDEILSMGERTSARLFSASLNSLGLKASFLDPSDPDWPIVTNNVHGMAEPIIDLCSKKIPDVIGSMLEEGITPVIPGFVGRSIEGDVTTLGRGGSDTTAFITAGMLGSPIVVLVTSVGGIMTADPKLVRSAKKHGQLSAEELAYLADSGVKFIHKSSLRYLKEGTRVKITSYLDEDLESEGTWVQGSLPALTIEGRPEPVTALVLAGRGVQSVHRALNCLVNFSSRGEMKLIGSIVNSNSIIAYVENGVEGDVLERLHESFIEEETALGVAVRSDLGCVIVKGAGLSERLGILGKVSQPLASNGINIHGVLTLGSNFTVFVNRDSVGRVAELIREALQKEV
ncbi:MAG: aspartate kinase [Thermoproteota archaeon]